MGVGGWYVWEDVMRLDMMFTARASVTSMETASPYLSPSIAPASSRTLLSHYAQWSCPKSSWRLACPAPASARAELILVAETCFQTFFSPFIGRATTCVPVSPVDPVVTRVQACAHEPEDSTLAAPTHQQSSSRSSAHGTTVVARLNSWKSSKNKNSDWK